MNVATDRKIIFGLQIVLDNRSLSSIGQKILMILPDRQWVVMFPFIAQQSHGGKIIESIHSPTVQKHGFTVNETFCEFDSRLVTQSWPY